jgi:RNA polymerase sigma factor (sigma-70 family)
MGADAAGLGIFLREIRSLRRLSTVEELELAAAIERHRKARQEARSRGESSFAHEVHDTALTLARQRLIEHNLWLVRSVAYRRRHCGVPFADLIQEGTLGLIHAVDRFDHHRGVRFSTYAFWWVRRAVSRAIGQQRRTVRLPLYLQDAILRYEQATERLKQSLKREPTGVEVRQALGINGATATRLLCAQQSELSLQARPLGEDSASLEEQLSDPEASDAPALIDRQRAVEALAAVLGTLDAREQSVVRRRFGFEDREQETLERIADDLRVSRQRTLQIEQKALGKLRKRAVARGLWGTSFN